MYHSVLCESGLSNGKTLDYVPSGLTGYTLHSFNTRNERDNFVEYHNAHSKLLYRAICAAIPSRVYKALKAKLDKWDKQRQESIERKIQLDIKKGYRFEDRKVNVEAVRFDCEVLENDIEEWTHDLKYTPRVYQDRLPILDRICDNKIKLWHLEKLLNEV